MPNDSGQPVYLSAEIRALERSAAGRAGATPLMQLAGLAAAEYARELLGEYGRNVLVLAGPGNNGGDAFEVAAHLKRWFYRVELVFAGDEHQLSEDALAALRRWRECGGNTYAAPPAALRPDLVVDGLFGIGLTRPLEGGYAELIAGINRLPGRKLALDIRQRHQRRYRRDHGHGPARHPHHHLHRAQARPAYARRPGSLW